MNLLSKTVFYSLACTGVGSLVHFIFFEKEVEEDKYKHLPVTIIRSVFTEISLAHHRIGCIMGRGGDKIRFIQWKTSTKIFFRDINYFDHLKVCVIKGTDEGVQEASKLVHEALLTYSEITTVPIFLPLRVCSLLLWNRGEKYHWLQQVTRTRIVVDKWAFHNHYSTRKVFVRGTYAQIQKVKMFVRNTMSKDNQLHPISISPASNPENWPELSIPLLEEYLEDSSPTIDDMFTTGNNGILELFVTYVKTPEKFWVQLIGPNLVRLDDLCEEMTRFYERSINRRTHAVNEVRVGMMVAVPREWDRKWYRGEIVSIAVDPDNDSESELEVFYMDFGEFGHLRKQDVCLIEPRFLSMPQQAIECAIANIFPKNGRNWTGVAINCFKEICGNGKWKTMSAKLIKYEARTNPTTGGARLPVAYLELADSTQRTYLDVAFELVKNGHAEWDFRRNLPPARGEDP